MPMYYPDLASVKACAESMTKNKGDQKYTGIIPQTEAELPQARTELAAYMRKVWGDDLAAVEIERAVTKETYQAAMEDHMREKLRAAGMENLFANQGDD